MAAPAAGVTVFEIVEEAAPVARAIQHFAKIHLTPVTSRIGTSFKPLQELLLGHAESIDATASGFSGLTTAVQIPRGIVALGGTVAYTSYSNTHVKELHKIHNSVIKTKVNTVERGKVHSIEPLSVSLYPKHIVIDKNYSTRRYFVNNSISNMPRTRKTKSLSTRLKKLEARVSPEVKLFEQSLTLNPGADTIAVQSFCTVGPGATNNGRLGNEFKVIKAEVFGQPLGGAVTSVTTPISLEGFIIKSKQSALPLASNFKPAPGDIGSVMDREFGTTLKHWTWGINNQTCKMKHRFRYPLRVTHSDAGTVVTNNLYFVLKNSSPTANTLPAGNNFTLRIYYVDP